MKCGAEKVKLSVRAYRRPEQGAASSRRARKIDPAIVY